MLLTIVALLEFLVVIKLGYDKSEKDGKSKNPVESGD